MAFSVGNKIPANSILRQGTLLIGIPRQEPPLPGQSDSKDDPMLSGMNALEASLQRQLAEAIGATGQSPQSASNTRNPSENK